jgi:hypothetical protein
VVRIKRMLAAEWGEDNVNVNPNAASGRNQIV